MKHEAPRLCAYGKLPAHGDFLRIGLTGAAGRGLCDWLQDAADRLARASAVLPARPLHFIYRDERPGEVAIGVLVPSQDSVGRKFPLAVFVSTAAAPIATQWSLVAHAYRAFFTAAGELALGAARKDLAQFTQQLAGLAPPGPDALARARSEQQTTLARAKVGPLLAATFAARPCAIEYAVHTLLTACRPLVGADPGRARIVLDCPIARADDHDLWTALTERTLAWRAAPPGVLWDDHRLLINLGAPLPIALRLHVDPAAAAPQLWPMTTDQSPARSRARALLTAQQRAVIDNPGAQLGQLIDALLQ
jgi:type VI secretion system protein ImpM